MERNPDTDATNDLTHREGRPPGGDGDERDTTTERDALDPVLRATDLHAVIAQHDGHPGDVDNQALLRRYWTVRETDERTPSAASDDETAAGVTAEAYADAICRLALEDPEQAGDWVGEMAVLAGGFDGDVARLAGKALNRVGDRRPRELERWTDALVELADAEAPDARFYGLRGLAQLAAANPQAAVGGVDTARTHLAADSDRVRKAAFAVVGEVAPTYPERARGVDRQLARALRDEVPEVRATAAVAAGRVLGEAAAQFPQTANALFDAVEADSATVREYANAALIHFAIESPHAVPEKDRVVCHLDALEDADLGLETGSVAAAQVVLLKRLADVDC